MQSRGYPDLIARVNEKAPLRARETSAALRSGRWQGTHDDADCKLVASSDSEFAAIFLIAAPFVGNGGW